jgi:predicted nucleic acid-binding protein
MGSRPSTGTRRPVLVDTDVLIEYLRGSDAAQQLFESIPYAGRVLSAIVAMELLQGVRNRSELRRLTRFFESAFGGGTVHISTEISRRASALLERHTLAHRMAPADALIAATALTERAALATGNHRHFAFVSGLSLIPFGE